MLLGFFLWAIGFVGNDVSNDFHGVVYCLSGKFEYVKLIVVFGFNRLF